MRYLGSPFEFVNNDIRDKWVQKFMGITNDICTKYNLPWPLNQITLEIANQKVCLISTGTYVAGSNVERAIKEILKAYEATFSN